MTESNDIEQLRKCTTESKTVAELCAKRVSKHAHHAHLLIMILTSEVDTSMVSGKILAS